MKFCPLCANELDKATVNDIERLVCTAGDCEFIHWNNPTPVVAAVVEHEDKIVLANNVAWPAEVYALITGFLEQGESAEQGMIREVQEELGLETETISLINVYPFFRMNQIIIAYHVLAHGQITLNEELRSHKHIEKTDVLTWDSATGYALRDHLRSQGFEPGEINLFSKAERK